MPPFCLLSRLAATGARRQLVGSPPAASPSSSAPEAISLRVALPAVELLNGSWVGLAGRLYWYLHGGRGKEFSHWLVMGLLGGPGWQAVMVPAWGGGEGVESWVVMGLKQLHHVTLPAGRD